MDFMADCHKKVGFAKPARPVNEKGIISARLFGSDRFAGRNRKVIGRTDNKGVKSIFIFPVGHGAVSQGLVVQLDRGYPVLLIFGIFG